MNVLEMAQLLGNFGEFFGAIAVVATLGYLAIQIRQNTRSNYVIREQTANQQLTQMHQQIMGNTDLAELVARCRNPTPGDLSPGDEERVQRLANSYVNLYSNVENAFRRGEFPENAYERHRVAFRVTLTDYPALTPNMRAIVEHFDTDYYRIFKPLFE